MASHGGAAPSLTHPQAIVRTDLRYVPPISPFASPSISRHFRRNGTRGSVVGMGRHVACACVTVSLCRLHQGFRRPLQAQSPVLINTHLQNFPHPRAAWHAHAAWHGMVHRGT